MATAKKAATTKAAGTASKGSKKATMVAPRPAAKVNGAAPITKPTTMKIDASTTRNTHTAASIRRARRSAIVICVGVE